MVPYFSLPHICPLPATTPKRPCLASMTMPGSLQCRVSLGRTRFSSFPEFNSGNPY